jgi:hypothetical protein
MRIMIVISLLTLLTSLSNCSEKRISEKTNLGSVLVVNILKIKQDSIKLDFYDLNGDTVLSITNKYVAFNNNICYYFNESCEGTIFKDSKIIANLEYDLLFFYDAKEYMDKIEIAIGKIKVYCKNNSYLTLQSYQEHLKNYRIALNNNSPLKENPSVKAKVVPNFLNYEYSIIEFKGNWMLIKPSKEYNIDYPSGWVKWFEDSLLVEPIYLF